MPEDNPVLAALADITAASIEHGTLGPREHMIARIAALAAVSAPATSYLLHLGPVADVGITLDDVQGVLVAISPVVGTPQIVTAAANITQALGFAIAVA